MTYEEREALKAELKTELLKEMSVGRRDSRPWDEVKRSILPWIENIQQPMRHQMLSAISTIIRHKFGIRNLANLDFENVQVAKELASQIMYMVGERHPERR